MSIQYLARKHIEYAKLEGLSDRTARGTVERGATVVASQDKRRAPRSAVIIPTAIVRHLVGLGALEPANSPLVKETQHGVAGYEVTTLDSHPMANVTAHDQAAAAPETEASQ